MSRSQNEETASPESPSPSPTPPTTATSRLFAALRSSTTPPAPSPSSTTEQPTSPSPLLDDAAAAPSWSTGEPASPTDPPAEPGGILSIGKSGKVSKVGLRTAVGSGIRQVCKVIAVIAADEHERAAGLWHPDDEDVADIATPAASLIYRRLPEAARGSDVMDLLQLGLALAGYVGKNLRVRAEIRTLRQLQETYGITPDDTPAPAA